MPVNFLQIRSQITSMGSQAADWQARLQDKCDSARGLFVYFQLRNADLQEFVVQAAAQYPNLRCASPTLEPLNFHHAALPPIGQYILLAADGSQINPSRHDRVEFGVINIGALRMPIGLSEPARESIKTELLYHEGLYTRQGYVGEDMVALMRDLRERELLAELAKKETLPAVALTDGPLEPYREPRPNQDFERMLNNYLSQLRELGQNNAAAAGYVDKPASDLVVRLLELTLAENNAFTAIIQEHPLRGVRDMDLFGNLLQPGERSALFKIQSSLSKKFTGALELHFFFLKVGSESDSTLARVEIPGWVARSPELLDLLQGSIVQQCAQVGGRPYPYVLHRAHEIALVTLDEKERVEDMIVQEMMGQGIFLTKKSAKQTYKDQVGTRTRYK